MQKLTLNDIVDVQPMTLNYFEGNPSIRYHVVTPEEAAEREVADKKDKTWYRCHDFSRGYFWRRPSDGSVVFRYILEKLGIEFKDFPELPLEKVEEIVNKIKEDDEKERKLREENPIRYTIDAFVLPEFNEAELNLIRTATGRSAKEIAESEPILRSLDAEES
jgi:hypothetical protein